MALIRSADTGPTIASIEKSNILPPSKNGMGNRLKNATLMLKIARIMKKNEKPRARLCPVIAIIPKGPTKLPYPFFLKKVAMK